MSITYHQHRLQPDLVVEHIHDSSYMRIEASSRRGIAFLRLWMRPGRLLLLHPTGAGRFWCRHGEDDREQLIADAGLAGLIVNDVPDDCSYWSATPKTDDDDGEDE